MLWKETSPRDVAFTLLKLMFDIKTPDNSHFWWEGEGYIYMSTSLLFELLIIRNKISSPKDFESSRLYYTPLIIVISFFSNQIHGAVTLTHQNHVSL